MTLPSENRWYVVQTHARGESKALYNLMRQGYEAYLPQYMKLRRHARRTERVPAPLFPRYLFVRMDVSRTQWRAIRSTFGVSDLVCHGNEPAAVPAGVVEEIRNREAGDGFIVPRPPQAFAKGETLDLVAGAFAERTGLFECLTDDERVVVLLDMLGRQVRVEVPLKDISAVA